MEGIVLGSEVLYVSVLAWYAILRHKVCTNLEQDELINVKRESCLF